MNSKQILFYNSKYLLSNTIQKKMKTTIMKRFYCCASSLFSIDSYIIVQIIYPKSDEQRQRLGEAVKNILLFRSLDQV